MFDVVRVDIVRVVGRDDRRQDGDQHHGDENDCAQGPQGFSPGKGGDLPSCRGQPGRDRLDVGKGDASLA